MRSKARWERRWKLTPNLLHKRAALRRIPAGEDRKPVHGEEAHKTTGWRGGGRGMQDGDSPLLLPAGTGRRQGPYPVEGLKVFVGEETTNFGQGIPGTVLVVAGTPDMSLKLGSGCQPRFREVHHAGVLLLRRGFFGPAVDRALGSRRLATHSIGG